MSVDRRSDDRHGSPRRCGAYVKLMRAGRAVLARVEPRLAAAGLTPTQLGVLEAILHKGPLTQRELGRKVLTSAGNMTDVVDKLEARGLVRRTRSPRDRRVVPVELTQAGRTLIEALFPRHAARHRRGDGRADARARAGRSSAAVAAAKLGHGLTECEPRSRAASVPLQER